MSWPAAFSRASAPAASRTSPRRRTASILPSGSAGCAAAGAGTAREPYRSFVRKVEEAQAQARLRAEIAALEKDSRGWLKHGPGRDLPGRPGWAALVRPAPPPVKQAVDWLASPEFRRFAALLRTALAPHPEALAVVARVLDGET